MATGVASSTARVGRSPILRNAYGSATTEAFMIIAIATILVTRLYLELTGYPQVGGGTLHIAHALWGGAAMMLALLIGWLFIGFGVRAFAVVLGGIGFGLFLDEVGKFVTKNNDYFYGPSAEIMYVLVVVVLVGNRIVRDARRPSREETLANAALIAAEGVAHGLPEHRREWALRMVARAEAEGADAETVSGLRLLLGNCSPGSARLYTMRRFAPRLIPAFFKSPRWVPVVAWGLTLASFAGVVFGIVQLVVGDFHFDSEDTTLDIDRMGISSGILFLSSCTTFALSLPSAVALRNKKLWPLRMLRIAALIFTMLNALVDFAQEGFAALGNVAIGLFTMAVLSHRIAVRTAEIAENNFSHGDVLSMPE
ncbi:hypothetical protein HQ346_13770 [Rhodococcus sp. BP-252]|uniref:hypothetical protein n=1 Tax=unclassified Rhodococcus (in: high G+C Gram-positive bacteria) TaxID=192944 RepID=UPI001430FC56|nr:MULTISPECIES: hypothetical protein [unclassified Rhodococcus (in: high G+C Gram-positive bacteria)]MBY6412715.1 hypothetical protein [Rhodococcus sp. BP-320]MBY6417487.1 hypothetical protein [Rhodococcus sp. BP-321]MBY6421735.1 hypothetical protein [Rhodococcus sp. BP-324]MBY6427474.1 hypothetical protein [Rhodococcus sp. BP-323]MBY6432675.1 hypothetical protein [Rhodococcus sp. BP-322]